MRVLLMLSLLSPLAVADDWGTLFFSAEQRASAQQRQSPVASAASEVAHAPQAAEARLYNGVLQTPRKKTYWVDGQARADAPKGKPGDVIVTP